jgi:transposase-like protein
LTIVDHVQDVLAEGDRQTQGSVVKTRRSRRRRLNLDEEREIARLYAETGTSTSQICAQFGIGESSLYRVIQRQGIPPRGRSASSKAPGGQPVQAPKTRRSRSSSTGVPAASPSRSMTASGQSRAGRRANGRVAPSGRAPRTEPTTSRTGSASSPAVAVGRQFRIRYRAERVFEARNVQDALRQAESLGATDITEVVREDR